MTDNQTERVVDLGFDRVVERLREVVNALETGNLSLEDALRVYEEGVHLARRGHELLDNAEKRVEVLVREGRDGLTTKPFDVAAEDGPAGNNEDE